MEIQPTSYSVNITYVLGIASKILFSMQELPVDLFVSLLPALHERPVLLRHLVEKVPYGLLEILRHLCKR